MPRHEYKAANDLSRNEADHHTEPWSPEEYEFLQGMWDGTEETLAEVARALGRTIEACRQKHYQGAGGAPRQPGTQAHQSGWLVGLCSSCGRIADVYCTGLTQECEDCR